jgi:hypothetical protein
VLFGIVWFDHYLESKIRRDLQRLIKVQKSFDMLGEELK